MSPVRKSEQANDKRRAAGGRLFRKYALLFGSVVSVLLLVGGLFQIWFASRELNDALVRLQHEQAEAAAGKIGQFVTEIEDQIGWTTQLPWTAASLEQRRFDAQRLLRQVPAITDLSMIDGNGKEQVRVSRLSMDVLGSGKDYSGNPEFTEALAHGHWYGPVYFRHDSEPYMSISVAGNRKSAGVSVAEVNLKFIWDVVSHIRVGKKGSAYVADQHGRLVAHPDIALVLRKTDLSQLPQFRAAIETANDPSNSGAGKARDFRGNSVFSASAPIAPLGWWVFVDLPAGEAYAPIYAGMMRSGALLVAGLVIALLAALLLASRIVVPIRALQEGARLIGEGDLGQRIDIRTGDELEDLASQFNRMGGQLHDLYDNLDRVSQLKRYFSPQLAEMIVSSKENIIGESHRRDISVVFCDLRNFTSFASASEPEVVMEVLGAYYESLGIWVRLSEATIGHFAGDGLMVFLNDPLPCPDHQLRAAAMAMAMMREVSTLTRQWQARGINLGFGIGIASGEATLGHIGSRDQFHYTAIGPVVNLASRLCDEAEGGQILISKSVRDEIATAAEIISLGNRSLKGFPGPVEVFGLQGLTASLQDLIDGGAPASGV